MNSEATVLVVGRIVRLRKGTSIELVQEERAEEKKRVRPLRVARTLALAHVFRELIDAGVVQDQAELARVTGFTRARITQMLDLTLLAPEIQEEILMAEEGALDRMPERRLRSVVALRDWGEQRRVWDALRSTAADSFRPSPGE
ncbi:MAG: hypothetical protein MUF54_18900 [Polyangiaceae bacterium]|jgi:hypothetical protein|nr:hypothetical protein [Polyangiaceae bacterium]